MPAAVPIAIVASSVIGGIAAKKAGQSQSDAANAAAAASQASTTASIAESQRQYDTTRSDFAPYREAGVGALNRLNAASTGDLSSFNASPSYNFTRSEGQRDIGNSFAARGGAGSGNALKALAQFNQGLASGEFNNWWNQQTGLANIGASGTSGTAQAGAAASGQIVNSLQNNGINQGNALINAGNARASGITGVGNSFNQGLGNYLLYQNMMKTQTPLKVSGLPSSAYNVPRYG